MRYLVLVILLCGLGVSAQQAPVKFEKINVLKPSQETTPKATAAENRQPFQVITNSTPIKAESMDVKIVAKPVAFKTIQAVNQLPSVQSIMQAAQLLEGRRIELQAFLENYKNVPANENTTVKAKIGEESTTPNKRFPTALREFLGEENYAIYRKSFLR
ncbi:hypothetical protein [Nonlabens ponticola]|uniref:Uncharacterized protein n=1 Tax=Nonlabens ponticola TaxID=2496866 RepID=A0A3S9MXQ2_9FLAO|nr:hypothetical protein [Nonlabens ponticola]AZQ43823.1 hypothetical protein EJ995_06115 [Nonlabens ponticola]